MLLRDSHKFGDRPLPGQVEMGVVVSLICQIRVETTQMSLLGPFWIQSTPANTNTPSAHLVHESAYEVDEAYLQLGELSCFVPVHHGLVKKTQADDMGAVSPYETLLAKTFLAESIPCLKPPLNSSSH